MTGYFHGHLKVFFWIVDGLYSFAPQSPGPLFLRSVTH
jgi:hypothetical protein